LTLSLFFVILQNAMTESRARPSEVAGAITLQEIFQQPTLWPTTIGRIKAGKAPISWISRTAIVTGAGTSAYAADAIARAWPAARAVPATDLLLRSKNELADANPSFPEQGLLVSIARSGDSPESVAVVEKIRRLFPAVKHLVITCNASGHLAKLDGIEAIVLDERTNDRSLVMTSSFTNLVLAGLAITHLDQLAPVLGDICRRAEDLLPRLRAFAQELAQTDVRRVVILASGDLKPLATEVSLKLLEMTAGAVVPIAETFLGLRHGPMSFLRPDTLVLCWISSDPLRQKYEADLIGELQSKNLGRIVTIGSVNDPSGKVDTAVPAVVPKLPDSLRVPFEIPFGQLLGYELSLRCGLNPDNPSPNGVITRVVQGFRVHEG
jgi:tagatose-6-phosphate ketose/aldose isomerase